MHNREAWLTAAVTALEKKLFLPRLLPMPSRWRISCSWPTRRAVAKKGGGKTIGQCFSAEASADNTHELIISMSQDDPSEIMAIVAHEMVHAAIGVSQGHNKVFRSLAVAIGLTGKMTATVAGEAFKRDVASILLELGEYPHAAINPSAVAKQTTRMVKMECSDCRYIARTSRANIQKSGPAICPCNRRPMRVS